jgi:hypothetical protein
MVEINQKKLYDHFVKTGQKERAEAILKVYPHFAEKTEKPKIEKTKKSN